MPDRFLDLTDGIAMVVTDLHGDRDAFDRYITQFRTLYATGEAQRLLLLGDLIHHYGPPAKDDSLNMLLDLMALRDEMGPDVVGMLLGNHEMPHIYGVALAKGEHEFTPRFEHALGDHRDQVLDFFDSLPFFVRTAAGVMLSHAGPALDSIHAAESLRQFDHQALLQEADAVLAQSEDPEALYRRYAALYSMPYQEAAWRMLAISGPDDPRYSHLMRAFLIGQQSQQFRVLWNILFTQNEYGLNEPAYLNGCQQFLAAFSTGAPAEQRVIISGHIVTPRGGFSLVNRHHLRLSSAAHAVPRETGHYLLLDCGQPLNSANQLVNGLRSVFRED